MALAVFAGIAAVDRTGLDRAWRRRAAAVLRRRLQPPTQSVRQAMSEAFGHRSYVLLVLGFFTCGFQLAFTTVHLPAYLLDRGLSAEIGGWTLAIIGLFNIIGSVTSGCLGSRDAQALHPVDHLFRARDLDRRLRHCCRRAPPPRSFMVPSPACSGSPRCRPPRDW